jgi:hypothetical protein
MSLPKTRHGWRNPSRVFAHASRKPIATHYSPASEPKSQTMDCESSDEIAETQNLKFSTATAFFSAADALESNMSDLLVRCRVAGRAKKHSGNGEIRKRNTGLRTAYAWIARRPSAFDWTPTRLERSQRVRKGQPLPPQLDVKIS